MADEKSEINQVDGIKKLSNEEKKKSREIILETIGEKSELENRPEIKSEIESVNTSAGVGKKIDGILHFASPKGLGEKPEDGKKEERGVDFNKKEEWRREIGKILPFTDDIKTDKAKQETRALTKSRLDSKTSKKPEKEKDLYSKKKNKLVFKKEDERRNILESKPAVKKETKDKQKTSYFSARTGQIRPLSKTYGSIKKFSVLSEKNKVAWHRLEQRANTIVRRALVYFFIFFAIAAIGYFLLVFIVVKFKLDNSGLRLVSKYVLIPAIITVDGPVDFYSYQDAKINLGLTDQSAEQEIIKNIILSNLYKKFKLTDKSLAGLDKLKEHIVRDEKINQAPLERIKKIGEILKSNNDFAAVSSKYGDESGRINISKNSANQYGFYDEVKSLEPNEMSGIVYAPEGYYIFKNTNSSQDFLDLSYVFVRTKSLDSYLEESMNSYKYFSLIN